MMKQKTDIREVLNEQVPEERDELYNDYVDENTPKLSWFANLCKAFLVGGLICTLGQVLINCTVRWEWTRRQRLCTIR